VYVIFPLITAEKGLYSITDVQIHINISTYIYVYFSVVDHVRILHKNILGLEHNHYVFMIGVEKNWEGGKVGRVRRPESLGG
jgi:hypothetical protein